MTIIVCLDNNDGMMFNHRRQSKDKNVISDILKTITKPPLFINTFSQPLFKEAEDKIYVSNAFLYEAKEDDFCFIENTPTVNFKDKISKIIVYKWNRDYPADLFFDIEYKKYTLSSTIDFAGTSHSKITKEVYIK